MILETSKITVDDSEFVCVAGERQTIIESYRMIVYILLAFVTLCVLLTTTEGDVYTSLSGPCYAPVQNLSSDVSTLNCWAYCPHFMRCCNHWASTPFATRKPLIKEPISLPYNTVGVALELMAMTTVGLHLSR